MTKVDLARKRIKPILPLPGPARC